MKTLIPYTFYLKIHILPDSKYRQLTTIYCISAIRLSWCLLIVLEAFRTASFFLISLYILLDRIQTFMHILIERLDNGCRYLYYYNQARITYFKIQFWIESVLYLSLFVIFWVC